MRILGRVWIRAKRWILDFGGDARAATQVMKVAKHRMHNDWSYCGVMSQAFCIEMDSWFGGDGRFFSVEAEWTRGIELGKVLKGLEKKDCLVKETLRSMICEAFGKFSKI